MLQGQLPRLQDRGTIPVPHTPLPPCPRPTHHPATFVTSALASIDPAATLFQNCRGWRGSTGAMDKLGDTASEVVEALHKKWLTLHQSESAKCRLQGVVLAAGAVVGFFVVSAAAGSGVCTWQRAHSSGGWSLGVPFFGWVFTGTPRLAFGRGVQPATVSCWADPRASVRARVTAQGVMRHMRACQRLRHSSRWYRGRPLTHRGTLPVGTAQASWRKTSGAYDARRQLRLRPRAVHHPRTRAHGHR